MNNFHVQETYLRRSTSSSILSLEVNSMLKRVAWTTSLIPDIMADMRSGNGFALDS